MTRPLATRNTHMSGPENQRTNTLKPAQTVGMAMVIFPIMILFCHVWLRDKYFPQSSRVKFSLSIILIKSTHSFISCYYRSSSATLKPCMLYWIFDLVFCYPAVKDPVSSESFLRKEHLHVEPRQKLRVYYQVRYFFLLGICRTAKRGCASDWVCTIL